MLLAFALGYFVYAKFIGEKIYQDREEIRTPAYEHEDGVDFVPTNKHILFGHTSRRSPEPHRSSDRASRRIGVCCRR